MEGVAAAVQRSQEHVPLGVPGKVVPGQVVLGLVPRNLPQYGAGHQGQAGNGEQSFDQHFGFNKQQ